MKHQNFNQWVIREDLNKWHKIDKQKFTPPPTSTNILFFTASGDIYCGYYKGSIGFVCYGIGAKALTDVEVTHWRIMDFPAEYQQMLDEIDLAASTPINTPEP